MKAFEYERQGLTLSEYTNVHTYVKSKKGLANKCEFCGSSQEKGVVYEWAKKRGLKYEKKVENFIMLCRSCHRRYDLTGRKPNNARKVKNNKGEIFESVWDAAKAKNILNTSIQNNLSGISKSAGGLKWEYYE